MVTIESQTNSFELNTQSVDNLIEQFNGKELERNGFISLLESHAKAYGFITNTCRKQTWKLLIDPIDETYSTGSNTCSY